MKITKKNRMVILLFLLPALVVYLVWVVWPIIEAIYMSMLKWETLNTTRFTECIQIQTVLQIIG